MSECGPNCPCGAGEGTPRMVTSTSSAKAALLGGLAALAANALASKPRGKGGVRAQWRRVRASPDHAPRKVRIR